MLLPLSIYGSGKMKAQNDSVGLRLERNVYERAMKAKEEARKNGIPAAYSTQSWFSYVVDEGLKVVKNE